jgi:hypothetical protein
MIVSTIRSWTSLNLSSDRMLPCWFVRQGPMPMRGTGEALPAMQLNHDQWRGFIEFSNQVLSPSLSISRSQGEYSVGPEWLGRDASSSPMVCAICVALSLWEYFKCFHSRMRVFTIDLHAKTPRVSILIQKALNFFETCSNKHWRRRLRPFRRKCW